jgi:hypothetical protein
MGAADARATRAKATANGFMVHSETGVVGSEWANRSFQVFAV